MKKGISLVVILFSLLLVGCDKAINISTENNENEIQEIGDNDNNDDIKEDSKNDDIKEDPKNESGVNTTNGIEFSNFSALTYSVTKYDSMYTQASAYVTEAKYMPELKTVCVNVGINDSQYRYVQYIARLGNSQADLSNARDKYFEIDRSGDDIYLCFNDLSEGDNYIHILRGISSDAFANVLLTFHYNDVEFSSRGKLTYFNIKDQTESSVALGGDSNITIDFNVRGDRDAIGKLVLKVFEHDRGEAIHVKEFDKDDLVFDGDSGSIQDYTIEGLAYGYEYHVAMLYYPPRDLENPILLDTMDIKSAQIEEIRSISKYHYIYTYIYDGMMQDDSISFKTYIKNDPSFKDNTTNEPFKLILNVYSPEDELEYSVPVVQGQESIVISREYITVGGRITIELEGYNFTIFSLPIK